MKIDKMNWTQVEAYLKNDDRCVLPLGCTEQHAYLSLSTDSILAEKVAQEAAEPLGVPVFPALAYGISPYFRTYPGSATLRVGTYLNVVRDILDAVYEQGFRRILVVNGHGGNLAAKTSVQEWVADHTHAGAIFHNWWNAPRTWAKVQEIDPVASHASWMENFPWTRIPGVQLPSERKPAVDFGRLEMLVSHQLRSALGDGNFGGLYQRPDTDMQAIWVVAVEETRALLENGWS